MVFTVLFNTKGFFVKDPGLKYIGGELAAYKNLDLDYWSYFEALGLAKDFDSSITNESVRLWWKPVGLELDSLKLLTMDIDALHMGGYAVEHNTEVEIYVEYNVKKDEVVDCPVCVGGIEDVGNEATDGEVEEVGNEDNGEYVNDIPFTIEDINDDEDSQDSEYAPSDSSDSSMEGIIFDDSEEELVMGLEDGFEQQPAADDVETNQPAPKRRLFGDDNQTPNQAPIPVSSEIHVMHPIEEEYYTDELDSASDSDLDAAPKPKLRKFALMN